MRRVIGLWGRIVGEYLALRYGVVSWWMARPYRLCRVCHKTWQCAWDAEHQDCKWCANDYEDYEDLPPECRWLIGPRKILRGIRIDR